MKDKSLKGKDEIWNNVIEALSTINYPTGNPLNDDAFLAFQYYSEMESGGHESFLNWFSEEARQKDFSQRLIAALEKVGAGNYVAIELEYGPDLRKQFFALENGMTSEKEFYKVIEKADAAYYSLNGQLAELLEVHFIEIYDEINRN